MSNNRDSSVYVCQRVTEPLTIDGDLTKPAWTSARRSPRFVDMTTGAPGFYDTYAAALWDEENFYVAFWVQEPFVEAHLTERDSIVFTENDVEVFIDGGDCYYEFEINAQNTVYEVFFVWRDAYKRGGRFDVPELDLLDHQPYVFGGDYDRQPATFWRGTHPRGTRWAYTDWDYAGLQTAVQVQGTMNDNSDLDQGWTVEIAFPWAGMAHLAGGRPVPPQPGDEWRFYMGRFEKLTPSGVEVSPHPAWAWQSHGVYDTHMPEKWTQVKFSDEVVGP